MPAGECGLGQHFQDLGHSFSLYEPTVSRQITYFFFSTVNWRTRNSDTRQTKMYVLKNRSISNNFMLVHQLSSPKSFAAVKFRANLKLYDRKTTSVSCWESLEIKYRTLSGRKRENSLCVFDKNSLKYSNDQKGLAHVYLKFYGERNTGLRAIIAPNNLSQFEFSYIEFSYSGFPCHLNRVIVALIYRRWECKEAKDW